jgi:hypothetical protein
MEDSKKKPIMIGVIVVCFIVAGLFTYARRGSGGGGINSIPEDKMTWVKCSNPSCKAEYEMGERAYYNAVKERVDPMARAMSMPPLTCEKCGKDSLFRAFKCANQSCGAVFIRGISGQNDHQDRCPECGQSETEEIRKRRLSGQE